MILSTLSPTTVIKPLWTWQDAFHINLAEEMNKF